MSGTLAIGGFVNHRKPIALMRQLAMTSPTFAPSTLVILSASVDLDLALALWPSIATLHCPFIGIEGVTAVSPYVRRCIQEGALDVPAWDTGMLALAIGGGGMTQAGLGTDLPLLNPWLTNEGEAIAVAALPIDRALIHAPYGLGANAVAYHDSPWGDALLAEHAIITSASYGQRLSADALRESFTQLAVHDCVQVSAWPTGDPPCASTDTVLLVGYANALQHDPSAETVLAWWARADAQRIVTDAST